MLNEEDDNVETNVDREIKKTENCKVSQRYELQRNRQQASWTCKYNEKYLEKYNRRTTNISTFAEEMEERKWLHEEI